MVQMYSEPETAQRLFGRINKAGFALAILFLLVAFPAMTSCSRRQAAAPTESALAAEAGSAQPAPAAAPGTQAQAGTAAAPAAAPTAFGAEGRQETKPASQKPKPRVPRPSLTASLRAFGLGSPTLARMPEDYSIGPLQSYRAAGEAAEAPLAVADGFMKALAAGKLDASLLAPYSRSALALLLAPEGSAQAGKDSLPYRLGTIGIEGDSAYLRVRLASSPGEERLEGSLALGKFDDAWFVEALSLDPPARDRAASAADGGSRRPAFDPARRASR
jgi:hypothetical protein